MHSKILISIFAPSSPKLYCLTAHFAPIPGRVCPGTAALLLQALQHGVLRPTAEHVRIPQGNDAPSACRWQHWFQMWPITFLLERKHFQKA